MDFGMVLIPTYFLTEAPLFSAAPARGEGAGFSRRRAVAGRRQHPLSSIGLQHARCYPIN